MDRQTGSSTARSVLLPTSEAHCMVDSEENQSPHSRRRVWYTFLGLGTYSSAQASSLALWFPGKRQKNCVGSGDVSAPDTSTSIPSAANALPRWEILSVVSALARGKLLKGSFILAERKSPCHCPKHKLDPRTGTSCSSYFLLIFPLFMLPH